MKASLPQAAWAQATCSDLKTLLRTLELDRRARELAKTAETPLQLAERLQHAALPCSAVRVLAYALPIRHAVWWECLCAFHAGQGALPENHDRSLRAAAAWVVDPSEERRRQAEQAGTVSDIDNVFGCAAWAAGKWNEPGTSARLVEAGVLFAADDLRERGATPSLPTLVRVGLQVAAGELPWPETVERAQP